MDLSLRSKRLAKLMYQKLILGLSGGGRFSSKGIRKMYTKEDIINIYHRIQDI